MAKEIGILCHLTSIPSEFGVGDFGKSARDFIDMLSENKINVWQILPLNETNKYNCPYASTCYFSYDEMFVDPEYLLEKKYIEDNDLKILRKLAKSKKVKYDLVKQEKHKIFSLAYKKISSKLKNDLQKYALDNPHIWDFAYFKSLLDEFQTDDWHKIPSNFFSRKNKTYKDFVESNQDKIIKYVYFQYILDKQWKSVREYARKKNIKILGDLPIYPEPNSFDVFSNPQTYLLDKTSYEPLVFGGVPADSFASNGQNWETCVYDWEYLKSKKYGYLIDKIKNLLEKYDILRLDHFLGYTIHYEINAKDGSKGKWIKAGGAEFFEELSKNVDMSRIVIEDLGLNKSEANSVRKQFNLKGMCVLSMAVGESINNRYLPGGVDQNSIYYLVTHDSDTFMGYLKKCTNKEKHRFCEVLEIDKKKNKEILLECIRKMLSSSSQMIILQIQDLLFEGNKSRMNIPGVKSGCWEYKVSGDYKDKLSETLNDIRKRL